MFENFQLTDLSHEIFSGMPEWPGKCPFYVDLIKDSDISLHNYTMSSGCSTHMDAPLHFIPGARSISDIPLTELLTPAVVINVQKQVLQDEDYALSVEDIRSWEEQFGSLPRGALVVANTGWFKRWPDIDAFQNKDRKGVMRFPGFSVDAAEYLLEKDVSGIGIDTLSLDCGIAHDYPVHKCILGADRFQLELMANLDAMPSQGAYILSLPAKFKGAPEAPVRVVGIHTKAL